MVMAVIKAWTRNADVGDLRPTPRPNIGNFGVIYERRTNGPVGAYLMVLRLYLFLTINTIVVKLLIKDIAKTMMCNRFLARLCRQHLV